MTKPVLVALSCLMVTSSGVAAQTIVRLELGVGGGIGGVHAGPAFRLGTGVVVGPWGGFVRASGHSGTQIGSVLGFPVQERLAEVGVLLTRRIVSRSAQQVLVGMGAGIASADRLNDRRDMESVPVVVGVPFEVTWQFGDGRGFGVGLSGQGHINPEVSFVALVLSLTFGF